MSTKYEFQKLSDDPDFEIDVLFDEEVLKQNKRQRLKKKLLVLFIILVLVILFILASLTAVSITLGIELTKYTYPDPPSYVHWEDMKNSVEFQITLKTPEQWFFREDMLKLWINSINDWSSYIKIDRDTPDLDDVYLQFHYHTEGSNHCNSVEGLKARYRSYVFGSGYTIDIKKDEDKSKNQACNQPYWPSKQYYNDDTLSWKCEEDVHPCFRKYTMESRVSFIQPQYVTTCQELANIFPDAFPKINKDNKNNPLDPYFNGYWKKLQWKGNCGNYTSWEITFTMEYTTMLDASRGNAIMDTGEFSLRFSVPNGELWEQDVVDDFQDLFYKLVLEYDVFEDHIECANEFYNGDRLAVQMSDQVDIKHID